MDFTFLQLFIDYWPLALFLIFGSWLMRRGSAGRYRANTILNTAAAYQQGLQYASPGSVSANADLISGSHHFSGVTRGVSWTLNVTRLQSEIDDGLVTHSEVSVRYTRWIATQARTHGARLVLMRLPEDVSRPHAQESARGRLAEMASSWGAFAALKLYFLGAFGAERIRNLALGPEHLLSMPVGISVANWIAFGNDPALLAKFSPDVFAHLWAAPLGAPAVLWDEEGLSLSWPVELLNAEAIAHCADHCVALLSMITAQNGS